MLFFTIFPKWFWQWVVGHFNRPELGTWGYMEEGLLGKKDDLSN